MPIDTKPVTRYLGEDSKGRALEELVEPLVVDLWLGGGRLQLYVPRGFVTDFASVPRFFWRVLPPNGPYRVAAIVHDFLYTTSCDRFLADAIFRDLMKRTGVVMWKRIVMYYAVRVFGGVGRKSSKRWREEKS